MGRAVGATGGGRARRAPCPAPAPPRRRARSSLREVDRAALPYHRDLDLARVLELLLDVARDPVREQRRGVVVDLLGLHDHADLAARLHRVDLLDALMALRVPLELARPLRVLRERLPGGPGARADSESAICTITA